MWCGPVPYLVGLAKRHTAVIADCRDDGSQCGLPHYCCFSRTNTAVGHPLLAGQTYDQGARVKRRKRFRTHLTWHSTSHLAVNMARCSRTAGSGGIAFHLNGPDTSAKVVMVTFTGAASAPRESRSKSLYRSRQNSSGAERKGTGVSTR